MEIERKFLISPQNLPDQLEQYPKAELEQAYIITNPVLRIRRKNDQYILTYKGPGLMEREEVEFPLPEDAYKTLLSKADGNPIHKVRYRIPDASGLTIELDVFKGLFTGLLLAEVEFPDLETANQYTPPTWFGPEVTHTNTYHNSTLSTLSEKEIQELIAKLS